MSFLSKEEKNQWFTIPTPVGSDGEIAPYCVYCYNNFRKYYELVENICIMCGKPAPKILENETATTRITAINDEPPAEMGRGTSMELVYDKLFKDESIKANHSSTRMEAKSIGEAFRMLKEADTPQPKATLGFVGKYAVKTQKPKIAKLDSSATE